MKTIGGEEAAPQRRSPRTKLPRRDIAKQIKPPKLSHKKKNPEAKLASLGGAHSSFSADLEVGASTVKRTRWQQ